MGRRRWKRQTPADQFRMSRDQREQGGPHRLWLLEPRANQIQRITGGQDAQPAFHRRDVMDTDQQRVGLNPGQQVPLHCIDGAGSDGRLRLLGHQRERHEVLQPRRFPRHPHIAVGIACVNWNVMEELPWPGLPCIGSLMPAGAIDRPLPGASKHRERPVQERLTRRPVHGELPRQRGQHWVGAAAERGS
ncbi:MAG: hypothetical protein UZ03_NOB001001436 [Nitrospira sp. OLB3]|nr:MAG: hypothetical protein UZ03_NOB001001436 [Nitrospira sp. OLB3]